MYTLDQEQVKRILVDEFDYHPVDAELYLEDYPPVHNELADAVRQWLDDRTVTDVSVSDVSISQVMRVRRCHFLMAIRYLNRLLDDDVTPEHGAQMADDLRHPIARW